MFQFWGSACVNTMVYLLLLLLPCAIHPVPSFTPTDRPIFHTAVNISTANEYNDNELAYSILVIFVLLIRAGLETNPGPVSGAGGWEGYSNNRPSISINPIGHPTTKYEPYEDDKHFFEKVVEHFKCEEEKDKEATEKMVAAAAAANAAAAAAEAEAKAMEANEKMAAAARRS